MADPTGLPHSPLGVAGTVVMGQSPKAEDVHPTSEGLPLLNGPTEFGSRSPSPVQWTTAYTRVAEPGDTLFCVRGSTTGRMNIADQRYAIGRGIAAIRGDTPTDTTYIRYALLGEMPRLLSLTAGSVFPNLSSGDMSGFPIPWPDPHDRGFVADTLGVLDDKIASNRRSSALARGLLDLMAARSSASLPTVELAQLVDTPRDGFKPQEFGNTIVDHFSLPAFDVDELPDRVPADAIMSNKHRVSKVSVLVSRLNPRIDRTWFAVPAADVPACASTEFCLMQPSAGSSIAAVWLAVRSGQFRTGLLSRVTGTSGSHQRVRPPDVLTLLVPDFREAPGDTDLATELLGLSHQRLSEAGRLAAFRDLLLPSLLSGGVRLAKGVGAA